MKNKIKISFNSSFSKSNFELINYQNQLFLKKKFSEPKDRDFESMQKNNFFKNNFKIKNLKINKIYIKNSTEFKKKKYFLTNYIDGYSGDLILKNHGLKEIKILKNFLKDYFNTLKKNMVWEKLEKKKFIKKINEISKNTKNKYLKNIFEANKKILIKNLNKIQNYPVGLCHGDLTLSNIIIKRNKIYLIDFLKTYNDGISQDLSKVFQEFVLGWSARHLNEDSILRSKIIYENILEKNFFNSFSNDIKTVLKFEILLTLFRIFPYVKNNDKTTIKWLENSIKKSINFKFK